MELDAVIKIIQNVGFPIGITLILFWGIFKVMSWVGGNLLKVGEWASTRIDKVIDEQTKFIVKLQEHQIVEEVNAEKLNGNVQKLTENHTDTLKLMQEMMDSWREERLRFLQEKNK